MLNAAGETVDQLFITKAVIITPGCVRLQVVRGKKYRVCAGTWFEWQNGEAAQSFRKAKMLNVPLRIPAKAVIGSDTVKDVEICWNRRWKGREQLLVSWVMCQ